MRDFGYDTELLARNELDDRNLVGLSGVVKVTRTVVNGTSLFSLDGFDRRSRWEDLSARQGRSELHDLQLHPDQPVPQLPSPLSSPLLGRLAGEKHTRAAMLFGRAFEQALAAYFRREDSAVTFYREWAAYQKQPLHYSERDSWDGMLQQGIQLLERFCQEDRVHVRQPRQQSTD